MNLSYTCIVQRQAYDNIFVVCNSSNCNTCSILLYNIIICVCMSVPVTIYCIPTPRFWTIMEIAEGHYPYNDETVLSCDMTDGRLYVVQAPSCSDEHSRTTDIHHKQLQMLGGKPFRRTCWKRGQRHKILYRSNTICFNMIFMIVIEQYFVPVLYM